MVISRNEILIATSLPIRIRTLIIISNFRWGSPLRFQFYLSFIQVNISFIPILIHNKWTRHQCFECKWDLSPFDFNKIYYLIFFPSHFPIYHIICCALSITCTPENLAMMCIKMHTNHAYNDIMTYKTLSNNKILKKNDLVN